MDKFKKCEVLLLHIDKAENTLLLRIGNKELYQYEKGYYFTQEYLKYLNALSHHLYILSDEEAKKLLQLRIDAMKNLLKNGKI